MADLQKKSAQLFDWSAASFGYRIQWGTGNPYADETAIQSDYIPVSNGTYRNDLGYFILGYDTSKNYVGSFNIDTRTWSKQFNNPSTYLYIQNNEVAYIKLLSYGSYEALSATTMFNAGNTQLPYEPYSSTGWLHSLRKLTTATEAVENPLYSDGTAITAYTISGNTVQNGTPTPSNPVDVTGVGVRTGNLFNSPLEQGTLAEGSAVGSTYTQTKGAAVTTRVRASNLIYVGGTATISVDFSKYYLYLLYFDANQQYTGENTATWQTEPVVVNTQYVGILIRNKNNTTLSPDTTDFNLMVNTGSTAKTYEPYGYKIPISSGGVTTNIYLGSTSSTRQIKKLVLTGTEDWIYQSDYNRFLITISDVAQFVVRQAPMLCTHYQVIDDGRPISDVPNNSVYFNNQYLCITTTDQSSKTDFNNYLAQQYAAGTPVTVWYVLATAETAAVNEPLMKIGTYADTLSNAASIPTTDGANSITVDTTVQPSEFTATWTGWHNASVKEKSANYLDENDFGLVEVAAGVYRTGTDVGVLPSGKYTLSANKSSSAVQIYRTTKNGSTYNYETISELPYTFTADGVSNQIFRTAGSTETSWADAGYSKVMLNAGETAQTYESYWK